MSVEDNISSVMQFKKGLTKQQQAEKLEELLDEFGLQHVRKSKGIQLSGGERRRTEIARALAIDPKFILLDEPFAGVDPIAVEDIQRIIFKLKRKNIGVLITDHNVHETLSITDRALPALRRQGADVRARPKPWPPTSTSARSISGHNFINYFRILENIYTLENISIKNEHQELDTNPMRLFQNTTCFEGMAVWLIRPR